MILGPNWKKELKNLKGRIRLYDSVFRYKTESGSYIVKKIGKVELDRLTFFADLDFVLQPLEIIKEGSEIYVVFEELRDILWNHNSYDFYDVAIKQLALLHHFSRENVTDISKVLLTKKKYQEELDVMQNIFSELGYFDKTRLFDIIREGVSKSNTNLLIHGDFLPFNILLNDTHPMFIDFGNSKFDFAERDIGRFLSDINIIQNTVDYINKRYYPIQFYQRLKNSYLDERSDLDGAYDKELGSNLIIVAEFLNYMDVVNACIVNKDYKSSWIKDNIRAIYNLLATYK